MRSRTRACRSSPSRTMAFTTSEATWLSLDLSPDGKTIVFELLGDLYTLPVTGGEATRITSGQAYDMQPAFSPDGKKLVFISDRNGSENVWIANADGTKPRADHDDRARQLHVADLGAGRRVRDCREGRAAVDLPRGRRLGRADDRRGRHARSRRRRRRRRRRRSSVRHSARTRSRCGSTFAATSAPDSRRASSPTNREADYDPHAAAQLGARRRSVSDRAARSRDGTPARPHARTRGRVPADPEPRRQVAGLLDALRLAPGAEADRPLDRRGSLAHDGRSARRQPGRRRARPRRLPEVRLHAGLEVPDHQLRRQALARRGPGRRRPSRSRSPRRSIRSSGRS